MSESTTEPLPEIESWTKEDVHRWLMTEVKVHQSCADRFIEEDVSGDVLDDFKKKDILDLGIKHGPAVKILFFLERLKSGSQHESQSPAENWTKEEVSQWLVKSARVDGEKAQRFQEEDVSGDCLVCFQEEDLLDLEVKKGRAVKILKELDRLKNKESSLHPFFGRFRRSFRKRQDRKTNEPQETPEQEEPLKQEQATVTLGRHKQTAENPAVIIKTTLDELDRDDFKTFKFHLRSYKMKDYNSIPRGKLDGKDTMDIASLMTDHYVDEDAVLVTRDILKKMNQHGLASQLEGNMGVKRVIQTGVKQDHTLFSSSVESEDTEDSESPSKTKGGEKKKKKSSFSAENNSFNIHFPPCLCCVVGAEVPGHGINNLNQLK